MSLRSMTHGIGVWGLLVWTGAVLAADGPAPLVVHEWGTFTALQDEHGTGLLGINVDTEPVPQFVHNLGRFLLNDSVLSSQHWIHRQKSVPRHHPSVSMRLETPVIYFYPPADAKRPLNIDVDVQFRGGWLTEFYPEASVQVPVVHDGKFQFTDLTPQTVGQISWKNLQIGTEGTGTATKEHVWLAPREVAAAGVTNSKGEYEKYLFYRGVGRQVAPLRVVTEDQGNSLSITPVFQNILRAQQRVTIKNLWLMEARPNGTCAYRKLNEIAAVNNGQKPLRIAALRRFSDTEFDPQNRSRLEAEMNGELLSEGLFEDEAKALLSTWQQAYFSSPGLRLFYTVPREWTDYFLPLTVSGTTQITRVMIGRIELISDSQRQLLKKLETSTVSKSDWLRQFPYDSPELRRLLSGHSDGRDLGVAVPADFQAYLDLGRFRNALVATEQAKTKSANLASFIRENHLDPFKLSQYSGK